MCSIGAMYLSSGNSIYKYISNELETALGKSNYAPYSQPLQSAQLQTACPWFIRAIIAILTPRFAKGQIPGMLTVTSAVTGALFRAYYGMLVYEDYR
jgi:hypothetical protein